MPNKNNDPDTTADSTTSTIEVTNSAEFIADTEEPQTNIGLEVLVNRHLGSNVETQRVNNKDMNETLESRFADEKDDSYFLDMMMEAHEEKGEDFSKLSLLIKTNKSVQDFLTAEKNKGKDLSKLSQLIETNNPVQDFLTAEKKKGKKSTLLQALQTDIQCAHKKPNSWAGKAMREEQERNYGHANTSIPGKDNILQNKHWFRRDMEYVNAKDGMIVKAQGGIANRGKNFAKSALNAITAGNLSGKNVTITLNSRNSATIREQIKALIEQANKRGIPLSMITIDTPNINQADGSFGQSVLGILMSTSRVQTPPKKMKLNQIVDDLADENPKYPYGKGLTDFCNNPFSQQSWARQMQINSIGTNSEHNKEAYKRGANNLGKVKANNLREQISVKETQLENYMRLKATKAPTEDCYKALKNLYDEDNNKWKLSGAEEAKYGKRINDILNNDKKLMQKWKEAKDSPAIYGPARLGYLKIASNENKLEAENRLSKITVNNKSAPEDSPTNHTRCPSSPE